MSVPSWRRKLSKTEYLFQTFQLCKYLGRIVANTPKKYAESYGDYLIQTSILALRHGQTANDIYVVDDSTFQSRRRELQLMRGCVENVATVAYIFLEIIRANDSLPMDKLNKMYDWEEEIGARSETICNLVGGVLKSDKEAYRELLKKRNNMGKPAQQRR